MPDTSQWKDLVLNVSKKDADTAQAIATTFTDAGLYIEDYSDLEDQVWEIAHVDLIEAELQEKPRDQVKIHLYFPAEREITPIVEAIHSRFLADGISGTIECAQIREQDWANEWKRYYHTTEIARRLAVVPSWETYSGNRIPLLLDPGMAFGTGTHETTLLCLEALDELVKGGEHLLDVGTGSGILGIAAALLGSGPVLGIDIDPVAVRTANENARLNKADARFTAKAGDLALGVSGQYQIITANIIADAIITLAPGLPALLAPGGVFLASGIISPRKEEVRKALEQAGFSQMEERQKKDWILFIAKQS